MPLRTFVSFQADFPTDGEPAGRELAEFVAAALRIAGITCSSPSERETWAWDIEAITGATRVEAIVGYSDDGPRQWQVHVYGHRTLFNRLLGRGVAECDAVLKALCEVIDQAVKADSRFQNIRWYERKVFDRDHGATWGGSPAD